MEDFFALHLEYGAERRRLDILQLDVQEDCLARIRERLTVRSRLDFLFAPEIVFAVASLSHHATSEHTGGAGGRGDR